MCKIIACFETGSCRLLADTVAKAVLQKVPKILRTAEALLV
jgi:hypothetical protein